MLVWNAISRAHSRTASTQCLAMVVVLWNARSLATGVRRSVGDFEGTRPIKAASRTLCLGMLVHALPAPLSRALGQHLVEIPVTLFNVNTIHLRRDEISVACARKMYA